MQVQALTDGKLSLKNDGALELFFIGVGAAKTKTLNQTNFLLIKGDHHVLVDFGQTGPKALLATAGIDPIDIDVVLPTHSHADHVGGIETMALDSRYVRTRFQNRPKVKLIVNEEYQRILWTHTLQGGLEWNEHMDEPESHLQFGDYFDVIRPTWRTFQPREVWTVRVGDINIEMFRTKHIPEQSDNWQVSFVSYGLFIDGHVFVSCDTRYDPDLLEMYGDRSSIMFHDVQFFPGAVHAPLSELRGAPDKYKRKLNFIHYADSWAEQDITGFAGFARQGVRYVFDD